MYKLKNAVIDRMVDRRISSRETDFLLYIAGFQDDTGCVASVYYKDVCKALGISIQKFYDILDSLKKKELISYIKNNTADLCVRILNNDFSDKNFTSGYLNVALHDFENGKFREMKAGAKLLYLYMQRFTEGKHMLVQNFYDEFCNRFHVARKSLQAYLRELRGKSFLFVSRKRNKAYHYEMMMKNSTVLKKIKSAVPREKEGYVHNVRELVKRNFSRYLPEKESGRVLQDIAELADTERARRHSNFVSLLIEAVTASITRQKDEGKKRQELNAALVNRCLTDILDRQVAGHFGISY